MDQSNESKTTVVERERSRKKTPTKRAKATKSPGNTLNSTVGSLASSNHNTILNNIAKSEKKTRKRRKKNTTNNIRKKRQKGKTKTRKTVTNSNLIPASNTSSEIITDQPINGFDTPGKGNDTAVKSNISGAHFMGGDEEISNDILGAYQSEPEEEIHDKNIEMESSVSKVNVHWEHFALLVEEYLLAIDVKM